jgi:initiation factor 1A
MTFKNYKGLFNNHKLIIKQGDDQIYGRVTQVLGNGRFLVSCFDGLQRICLVKGQFRYKRLLINSRLRNYFWIEKVHL